MDTPPLNAKTLVASQWLAIQPKPLNTTVVELRERFDLTPLEACLAIRHAQEIRRAG
ncbi:hypothetical protein QFZ34_003269 [Phyllobacterium ifriqiyense]|uniref:DUF3606 domain-containing protein n=1 Tax=Phyllobacterium ifriqiyense TaxID=314238 RepID=A0ABU0SBF3_9HYPH|nr:hypothetical protein [Phyllobacterium ifriqiyense]